LAEQKAIEAQQKENEARELEEQLREAKLRVCFFHYNIDFFLIKKFFHPIPEIGNSYFSFYFKE
jgi:hypothetical protein